VLWIELTSKCPFDCVFCSRQMRRGGGLHMEMPLYRRIIAELERPEIIRLNYSGESANHPHLIEAIELAAATGATTELVTALASLPDRLIEPLGQSGLDRLTLSLHTLDEGQYQDIYGYGSLDAVRRKTAALIAARERARRGPAVDLAVVAMRRNLDQLPRLADYADEIGASGLAIHPVIRRDPVPDPFTDELNGAQLRPDFLVDLKERLVEIRLRHPNLSLSVSTPELETAACLSAHPTAFSGLLPAGAQIHSCDQNPADTVHILADGAVVTCEVRDRIALGQVRADGTGGSLRDIWTGPAYRAFRAAYRAGEVNECRDCPYKIVFIPGPLATSIDAGTGASAQLRHGWHAPDGSGLLWAKSAAALELSRARNARRIHVRGVIPPHVGGLHMDIDGIRIDKLGESGHDLCWIETSHKLPPGRAGLASIVLTAERALTPVKSGAGADVRELGFGLKRIWLD
jgi:radical SAM protein with 4Fe4S-binding SPASM domain